MGDPDHDWLKKAARVVGTYGEIASTQNTPAERVSAYALMDIAESLRAIQDLLATANDMKAAEGIRDRYR